MNTFTINLLEVLIKGIPETILQIYSIYLLTKTKFTIKQVLLINALSVGFVICLKLLPIAYGARSLITLVFMMFLFIIINKIPINSLFKAAFITAIIVVSCEFANVYLLMVIYGKEQTISFFAQTLTKTISGIPSTVFFAGILIFIRLKLLKIPLLVTNNGKTIQENRKNDFIDSELQ